MRSAARLIDDLDVVARHADTIAFAHIRLVGQRNDAYAAAVELYRHFPARALVRVRCLAIRRASGRTQQHHALVGEAGANLERGDGGGRAAEAGVTPADARRTAHADAHPEGRPR